MNLKKEKRMYNNKCVFHGNLTRDIDPWKTENGKTVAFFTVAVKKKKPTDSASADFIDCRAWDKQAEYLSSYGKKGQRVFVEGHLETYNPTEEGKPKQIYVVVEDCHLEKKQTAEEQAE